MIIGTPKEIKNHEYRVGLTPESVHELTAHGHEVLVETGAGLGIGAHDDLYVKGADGLWRFQERLLSFFYYLHIKDYAAAMGRLERNIASGTPVPADVDRTTFNIDAADVARKVTPRTKAVIAVHLFGLCADIDALRHLIGEIESIRAFASSAIRGFEVADTASLAIRFENGVLGTFVISDAAVSPWAWEYTSGQALYHPKQPGACLFIAGNKAALSVSDMYLWRHGREGEHWQHPLVREHRPGDNSLTYENQLEHFIAVIERKVAPLISARDGMKTLAATLAVERASIEDRAISLTEMLKDAGAA